VPIHDWSRVAAGDFHHFHETWIPFLAGALNQGLLPPECMAMADQITGRPVPDVVTLQTRKSNGGPGGVAVATAPPSARVIAKLERINYATRTNRVLIRHRHGKVLAIIEILSPGNKESANAIRSLIDKSLDILNQGINLFIIDLFPPTPRDPEGIHKAIWDQFGAEPFDFLPEKPLTIASYIGGDMPVAYVDSVGIGDPLPSSPIFLSEDSYVSAPLEETYLQAWKLYPDFLKRMLDSSIAVADQESTEG